MASEVCHIDLANRNHDALQYVAAKGVEFPEWVATIAFYKAVHIVEAILARTNFHSESHSTRLDKVKLQPFSQDFHKHYRALWQASTIARYLRDNDTKTSYSQFIDYLPAEKVVEKLMRHRLKSIEDLSVSLLSATSKDKLRRTT